MKKFSIVLTTAGAALMLTACGTTAKYTPFAGFSNAPLAQTVVYANPDCDQTVCRAGSNVNPDRIVREDAIQTVTRYSVICNEDIGRQVAGPVQSGTSGGVVGGATGSALGPVAGSAFSYADVSRYTIYGLGAGAANGVASGLYLGAQGSAAAKGNCVRDFFGDVRQEFPGVHVGVALAGKRMGGDGIRRAPAAPAR